MLGDTVERGLIMVGITQERVRRWIGDCCCKERREKLNQIDAACRRILRGKIESGRRYLAELLEGSDDERQAAGVVFADGCSEEPPVHPRQEPVPEACTTEF